MLPHAVYLPKVVRARTYIGRFALNLFLAVF